MRYKSLAMILCPPKVCPHLQILPFLDSSELILENPEIHVLNSYYYTAQLWLLMNDPSTHKQKNPTNVGLENITRMGVN